MAVVGDNAAMQQQVAWASVRPEAEGLFFVLQAFNAAYYGKLARAHELCQLAMKAEQREGLKASSAATQAGASVWDADYGDWESARSHASAALASTPGQAAKVLAALSLAEARDVARSEAIAAELNREFPNATLLNNIWLPTIRAKVSMSRGDPSHAIKLLEVTLPYDLSESPPLPFLYPAYVRGQAYLRAQQPDAAAKEFQKILDHKGIAGASPVEAVARIGLARARAVSGDKTGARTAYQDFFALWKDADPDIPILKQAKAEYAKLQ
jgi:ATP/maltotriose-dependent transcriptional regulator MalT